MLHRPTLWAALLLALTVCGWTIAGHERTLRDGERMFFELAPLDPRSLMQGDHMALRFAIAAPIAEALRHAQPDAPARRRDVVVWVTLDERRVARLAGLEEQPAAGQHRLHVQVLGAPGPDGGIQLSTDAWFFQEGEARRWAPARYGEFAVAPDGTALLVGLRDEALRPL